MQIKRIAASSDEEKRQRPSDQGESLRTTEATQPGERKV